MDRDQRLGWRWRVCSLVNGRDNCPGVVKVSYETLSLEVAEYIISSISPVHLMKIAKTYWKASNEKLSLDLRLN
jgi:hypothetical protein